MSEAVNCERSEARGGGTMVHKVISVADSTLQHQPPKRAWFQFSKGKPGERWYHSFDPL